MAEFVHPFNGMVPDRKLTKEELIRAVRLDIAAELEATHLYMAHAEATDDPLAKKVLVDIANEERVHVGEFLRLAQLLTEDEDEWLGQGRDEVNAMAREVGRPADAGSLEAPKGGTEEVTVGSLKQLKQ